MVIKVGEKLVGQENYYNVEIKDVFFFIGDVLPKLSGRINISDTYIYKSFINGHTIPFNKKEISIIQSIERELKINKLQNDI